jgi:hypothetical protein
MEQRPSLDYDNRLSWNPKFHHFFSQQPVSKAVPPLENRNSFHCIVSIDFTDEL